MNGEPTDTTRTGKHLWQMLPRNLARELARHCGARVTRANEDLLRRYGDPPGPDFVEEAWPVLVTEWLSKRPTPRESLCSQLHQLGIEPLSADFTSRSGQLAYLLTCAPGENGAAPVISELTEYAQLHQNKTFPPGGDTDEWVDLRTGRRRSDGSICVRANRWDGGSSYLDAKRNRRGDLVFEGQSMGSDIEERFGRDEYEFTDTYTREVLPDVLAALGEDPSSDVLDVIAARWCGNEASYRMERVLAEAGIKPKRSSY